jgi:hypothetical protein
MELLRNECVWVHVYKVQTNKLWTPFPPPPWGLILAPILTPTEKKAKKKKTFLLDDFSLFKI